MLHNTPEFNPEDAELISAYVDGELSGEEQGRVEQLLASRPECQRLLEELRGQRSGLSSLPRRHLPASFADEVLARIDAQKLTASTTVSAAHSDRRGDSEESLLLKSLRKPRTWLWPAAAIATALVIAMFDRNAQDVQVSQAPTAASKHEQSELKLSAPRDVQISNGAALEGVGQADRNASFGISADQAAPTAPESAAFRALGRESSESLHDSMPTDSDADGGAAFTAGAPMVAGVSVQPTDQMLIVNCAVNDEAYRNGAVTELFRSQNINFEPPAALVCETNSAAADTKEHEAHTLAYETQGRRDVPRFGCVFVEAPASKLKATLAEMNVNHRDFVAVDVEPPLDEADAQQWGWYSREASAAEDQSPGSGASPTAEAKLSEEQVADSPADRPAARPQPTPYYSLPVAEGAAGAQPVTEELRVDQNVPIEQQAPQLVSQLETLKTRSKTARKDGPQAVARYLIIPAELQNSGNALENCQAPLPSNSLRKARGMQKRFGRTERYAAPPVTASTDAASNDEASNDAANSDKTNTDKANNDAMNRRRLAGAQVAADGDPPQRAMFYFHVVDPAHVKDTESTPPADPGPTPEGM